MCKYCQILDPYKRDYIVHVQVTTCSCWLFWTHSEKSKVYILCAIKRMIKGQVLSVFNLVELSEL